MDELRIITTSDGSHSLLNTQRNETYHSIHGAVQESNHVFILHGLNHWLERNKKKEIKILEIGFGTGLNAFLTLLHSTPSGIHMYYESWEAHPLEMDIIKQLNYPDVLGSPELFSGIHEASWEEPVAIIPEFTLHKRKGDILIDPLGESLLFDLIYYDAFAPAKQPEMWTLEVLKKVTDSLAQAGTWITYCAKGQVKRDLKTLGLTVETLPGPPGKKEMIRALR